MIRLHPIPYADHTCPYCGVKLEVKGWYIPGMRNLADLKCPQCGREFYGDLPAGHGLYYPMLLERATGIVHDEHHVDWFANWLRDSYANRVNSPVGFTVEEFRPLNQPLLLNCLDTLYGHCLLKLLNAQYYLDHRSDLDLVVLVPLFLRWMVPEGAAAIWTVDLPLKRGIEWNDWLAAAIKRQIEPLEACWLSIALSHPHPEDFSIERFTRVKPFPIEEWGKRMSQPTVTFIWREDRLWDERMQTTRWTGFKGKLPPRVRAAGGWLLRRMKQAYHVLSPPCGALESQMQRVITVAQILRHVFPKLDFAVAGLGQRGGLPDWITDLRTVDPDESLEKKWCERYAESHVVVGVHGSNMLLPSAHVGAVVELVPPDRWGNLLQDILISAQDVREALYRCRFLPIEATPTIVAEVTASLLRYLSVALLTFKRPWCDHETIQTEPRLVVRKRSEIVRELSGLL